MYQISVKSNFSSAHNLKKYKGKCENLHGHNWNVELFLEALELNEEGMIMDFVEVKKILNEIIDKLDHKYINEIPPFDVLNPTSENIAKYIFSEIKPKINPSTVIVKRVDIWETDSSRASYYEKK